MREILKSEQEKKTVHLDEFDSSSQYTCMLIFEKKEVTEKYDSSDNRTILTFVYDRYPMAIVN